MKRIFFIRESIISLAGTLIKSREKFADLMMLVVSAFMLLGLGACGSNDIQLPSQRVTGLVGGEEWNYKSASARLFSSDLKYQIKFLSIRETGEDPCTVPSPGHAFISIIISPQPGSFSIPLTGVDLQESARFHISAGNTPLATSGFLEIFGIDNQRIFGYIQAQLDDENSVEGSFEALICD